MPFTSPRSFPAAREPTREAVAYLVSVYFMRRFNEREDLVGVLPSLPGSCWVADFFDRYEAILERSLRECLRIWEAGHVGEPVTGTRSAKPPAGPEVEISPFTQLAARCEHLDALCALARDAAHRGRVCDILSRLGEELAAWLGEPRAARRRTFDSFNEMLTCTTVGILHPGELAGEIEHRRRMIAASADPTPGHLDGLIDLYFLRDLHNGTELIQDILSLPRGEDRLLARCAGAGLRALWTTAPFTLDIVEFADEGMLPRSCEAELAALLESWERTVRTWIDERVCPEAGTDTLLFPRSYLATPQAFLRAVRDARARSS